MTIKPKKHSHFLHAVVLVAIAVCTLLSVPAAYAATGRTVNIGVLAKRGKERCLEKWGLTADYLMREVPGYTFRIVPLGFQEILPAVEREEVDFVFANPPLYVEMEVLYGASRIATLKNLQMGKPCTEYAGAIFCRADRGDIQTIADLKGKSFMAVDEKSFGGWQMAWRKMKHNGIDIHKDLADLRFGGTHDTVVYAVRDGKVDAGTVRSDTLERMQQEGIIRLDEFRVISPHCPPGERLPLLHSTRHYPEWPLAVCAQTPDELAEKVAVALIGMSPDSPAARTARCAGWTIPRHYRPVHDCLRELRIGPYEDYGRVTFRQMLRQYWQWLAGGAALVLAAVLSAIYVVRLNRKLRVAVVEQQKEITERNRMQQRYSTIIHTALEGFWLCDMECRFLEVNESYCKMTGYSQEELLRMSIPDIEAQKTGEEIVKHVQEIVRTGAQHFETRHRCKDGKIIDVEVSCQYLFLEEPRFVVFTRDITERKREEKNRRKLETQMHHTQKLESLGVLAGGIAHDFNNLLMVVLGNADMAMRKMAELAPARENLDEIKKAGTRAAELTNQMLAYSGKGRFVVKPVNLNELIEEMGRLLEVSISKKVILRYDMADELPAVEVDVAQIRQVVMNLITNASEAIEDKSGTISLATGVVEVDRQYLSGMYGDLPEGYYVFVEVSDTGCGMDKETLARLFEPFFTTKFTGRGLGLAAVMGIVRGHGGNLKIYSEVGKGTTFKVLLPCSDRPAAPETEVVESAENLASGTVLVADDEKAVRTIAKMMLEDVGLTVLTAGDGQEAVELYRERGDEIDAVLLDMTMPRLDGEEAFRELRRLDPQVKVILSSGYNEQEATNRFIGKGLAGFIQKPYEMDSLIGKLREVLGR